MPLNIDWQQILLHLFNFVILAAGLGFLLFKPVKKFMDDRKRHFEDKEKNSAEREARAQSLEEEYENKLDCVEAEIAEKKQAAEIDAESALRVRTELAHAQAESILDSARKSADAEKDKIYDGARRDIADMVVSATEKLLMESSSAANDAELYERFLSRAAKTGSAETGAKPDLAPANREAQTYLRKARLQADRIVSDAERRAAAAGGAVLDLARGGIVDAVVETTEKVLREQRGEKSDLALYDSFLAEMSKEN